MIKKCCVVMIGLLLSGELCYSQVVDATIYEEKITLKTYPFSDPDPTPQVGRMYPYSYFHGYTNQGKEQEWNLVVLENEHIKVYVAPAVGGKIWGAIEKSTGKEFLYFNHVVKFRDVAMRGAWTSGGLEYNFGDIGHMPTCATPVDYFTKKNSDGSVSCVVGAIDLPSGTKWNVEIIVRPKQAFFETKASWFNNTALPTTYYHWMNAAAKSSGNLEFIYPGNKRIGHGGELGEWPLENGRDISRYENNNFGIYKSYHVINSYSDFFGGYWHDDDFGFGHWANYDEKPGKKLWIWGLSQQGMIWEDLLSDGDGQYIEYQAGKLFNQAANNSTFTPFKHKEFAPHDGDIMNEIWFPLKKTGGMSAASKHGVLHITENKKQLKIVVGALQPIDEMLTVKQKGKVIKQVPVALNTLENTIITLPLPDADYVIELGTGKLAYSSNPDDILVDRPIAPNPLFNWDSAYGTYTRALELEKQRRFEEALAAYLQAIEKDPGFTPALTRAALGYFRKMDYDSALARINSALSIDIYDGEANYIFGLIQVKKGNIPNAKSGFSIATASRQYRVPSYIELARLFLKEQDYGKVMHYTQKAIDFDSHNPIAYQLQAIAYRKTGQSEQAKKSLNQLFDLDATWHLLRFETYLLEKTAAAKTTFAKHITNELPTETYLDLAITYYKLGLAEEALLVLEMAPEHPLVHFWIAFLDAGQAQQHLQKALAASPYQVFPFRSETATVLEHFNAQTDSWKLKYYQGLIYWSKGLEQKARARFDACGDRPDFAPFYLVQNQFTTDVAQQAKHLKKARKLAPNDWRVALALTNHLLSQNKSKAAVALSKEFVGKYPEQASVGLSYARSLLKSENYLKTLDFLESYQLLPFEGATVGRDIYHEVCLRRAFDALKRKDYEATVAFAQKAKRWPQNLGVGKPYDVDERLDDYVIAYAYEKSGKKKKADEFYDKVMNHRTPAGQNESTKVFLQCMVLKSRKQNAKAKLDAAVEKFPKNPYLKWARMKFERNTGADKLRDKIINTPIVLQPYDTRFIDREFQLVTDFVTFLGKE